MAIAITRPRSPPPKKKENLAMPLATISHNNRKNVKWYIFVELCHLTSYNTQHSLTIIQLVQIIIWLIHSFIHHCAEKSRHILPRGWRQLLSTADRVTCTEQFVRRGNTAVPWHPSSGDDTSQTLRVMKAVVSRR